MSGNTFGAKLRSLRTQKNIGLREFAHRLGVTPTYISQIEQNYCKPPKAHVVEKMAQLLGQNADEFLTLAGRLPEELCEVIRSHLPEKCRQVVRIPSRRIRPSSKSSPKSKQCRLRHRP